MAGAVRSRSLRPGEGDGGDEKGETMTSQPRTTMTLLAAAGLLTGAVIGGGLGFALGYPEKPGADPKKPEGPARPVATAAGVVVGGIAGLLAVIIRMSRSEEAEPHPPRRRARKGRRG